MEVKHLSTSKLIDKPLTSKNAEFLYYKYPSTPKTINEGCPSCHGEKILWHAGEKYECNCLDQLQRYKHYLSAGIPLRYQKLTWRDWDNPDFSLFTGDISKYIDNLETYINNGIGLFLWGSNGSGKSLILSLILKELVAMGKSCYMTTASELSDLIKASWNSEIDKRFYIDKIEQSDVLFIDDLGRELIDMDTNWSDKFNKTSIDNIIRGRVQDGKTNFITTNLKESQFQNYYGRGLSSLIAESMLKFYVNGEDFRSKINNNLLSTGMMNRPIF